MIIPTDLTLLKGFRFLREIIAYALWAYHPFALSTADAEDLLAARAVIISPCRLAVNYKTAYSMISETYLRT